MSELILPLHDSMGRPLWCIHSAWATVLYEWQHAHDDQSYWQGIEFDKLAHAVHLIWNALYKLPKTVSFQSPYKSCPGIHGPGPALSRKDNRPVYALDFIAHIQKTLEGNPDICLFALNERTWQGRKIYYVKPGKPQAWLLGYQANIAKSAFEDSDVLYIKAISRIFSKMTKEEIRAIGTHQSREGTLEAIEFNVYIHFFQKLMLEFEALQSGMAQTRGNSPIKKSNLPSFSSLITEIKKKSYTNAKPYSLARRKIDRACGALEIDEESKVANLAMDIFRDPREIWGGDGEVHSVTMLTWKKLAGKLENLIKYMKALNVVFSCSPESENKKEKAMRQEKANRDYDDGIKSIDQIHSGFNVSMPPLPRRTEKSFQWYELLSSLFNIFDSLPGTTKYRKKYERKKATIFCQIS